MPSTDTRAALLERLEGIAERLGRMGGWADDAADIGEAADLLARSAPEERGEGEDPGCSMAGRIDVSPGHGSDGTCAVRGGEPCPRACLLRTIGHLQAQARAAEVSAAYLAAPVGSPIADRADWLTEYERRKLALTEAVWQCADRDEDDTPYEERAAEQERAERALDEHVERHASPPAPVEGEPREVGIARTGREGWQSWECPRCGSRLGAGVEVCDREYDEDGGYTPHPPVYRPDGVAAPVEGERAGIYVASKTKHAGKWLALRERGYPICSTWIDEAEPGATLDWSGLWDRCTREASRSAVLVLYAEAGEVLTGALVELGAALSHGVPVLFVGDPAALRNVARDGRIQHRATLSDAMDEARALAALPVQGEREEREGRFSFDVFWSDEDRAYVAALRRPSNWHFSGIGATPLDAMRELMVPIDMALEDKAASPAPSAPEEEP